MNLIINGKDEVISSEKERINVFELLKVWSVEMPDMVSVQLNDVLLYKADFENTFIKEGDQVEFLYFMGGGR